MSSGSARGKILVIRGGAIGDFILTLPVLAALRKSFPAAHLEVLGYPRVATLAHLGGLADAVRSIEERGFAQFFAKGVKPPADLAGYFSGFNLVVSYLFDPELVFQENVSACGGAQFITGPHRPSDTATQHATELLLKPLERLAIFEADTTPRLALPRAMAAGARTVALHPGSGSERKNWPETNWRWLVTQLLAETDWKLVLIGGEAEGARLQRLLPQPNPRVTVLQNRPLTEVATALAGADLFVGHDSGISHLAAAIGLPGVALWAHTNETVWRPRSDKFRLLRSPAGLHGISVDTVLNALRETMPTKA
jgi:heptosyltransferase-2